MGVHIIPERDSSGHIIQGRSPFAVKEIDGKKLFKRVHGVIIDCVEGDNTFDLVIPYDTAKLNQIDVLWADEGCTVDFKVYDTPVGTISSNLEATNYTAIPNLMLNQFGFGAGVAKDHFKQHSEYDADVIKDMKLQAVITVPTGGAKKMCVNFILNETK